MEKSELPKIRVWSRNEMEKRIAIFSNFHVISELSMASLVASICLDIASSYKLSV